MNGLGVGTELTVCLGILVASIAFFLSGAALYSDAIKNRRLK